MPLVRFEPDRLREGIAAVERTWRTLFPDLRWHSSNLMATDYYSSEERQAIALTLATVGALVITCMGLLALTALTIRQRTKEVGIRKVLGAGTGSLVFLLCREYAVLVCLGNALAAPAAYWLARRWLEGFAYRIDLGPGLFTVVGLTTLVVALATVVGHSLRTALANPVDALRYE
jgi:putative ABC transport system permease protein